MISTIIVYCRVLECAIILSLEGAHERGDGGRSPQSQVLLLVRAAQKSKSLERINGYGNHQWNAETNTQ